MPAPDHQRYDVLVALNYYAPYVSGVTETARVVAEGLAARGMRVLVVCGHHDPTTPARDRLNGVDVIRTRVAATIGKGIVSPALVPTIARWARRSAVVHLHAPMLEAGAIAAAVHRRTPVVVTYHCDVDLPPTWFNDFQVRVLDRSHAAAVERARAVVVTSEDYASRSRLGQLLVGRSVEIPPPCLLRPSGSATYRDGHGLHVGFLGRIVEEKGLEHLVAGFRELGPDARLLIGGEFAKVAGGSVVEKVRAAIDGDPRVRMLGFVPDDRLADFYASLDVFALTSVNSLEAFGIVQAEAMMLGIPCVASNLPGVRVPVRRTGFGEVVPPRDPAAIARALETVASSAIDRATGAASARELFLADNVVDRHAELLREVGGRT